MKRKTKTTKEYIKDYEREIKLAKRRAKLLPENWDLYLPKTLPKNEIQARKRIAELRKISIRNYRDNTLSKYVKYSKSITRPLKFGGNYQSFPLTQSQYIKAGKAYQNQIKADKKFGMITQEKPFNSIFKDYAGYKQFIDNRSSVKKAMQLTLKKGGVFVDNFVKSLKSNIAILENDTDEEDVKFTIDAYNKIIDWIEKSSLEEVHNKVYRLVNKLDDSFVIEIFGSDQKNISTYNMVEFMEFWMNEGILEKIERQDLRKFTGRIYKPVRTSFIRRT